MRKGLTVVAVAAALPFGAQAQSVPGFYAGAEGGLNRMFNKTFFGNLTNPDDVVPFSVPTITSFDTGWALGGMVGYDFVGPRVELEGLFRHNGGTLSSNIAGVTITRSGIAVDQTTVMGNVYYDFMADRAFTPYIGAGAGIAFVKTGFGQQILGQSFDVDSMSTQFAYQYMMGVGYKIAPNLRLNLEGRYYATTAPVFERYGSFSGIPLTLSGSYPNSNVTVLASLQYKFGAPSEAASSVPTPDAKPATVQGQGMRGLYVGVEGGVNWLFNTDFYNDFYANFSVDGGLVPLALPNKVSFAAGSALGGVVGYDFVGPRIELEGVARQNNGTVSFNSARANIGSGAINVSQTSVMANVYYDFMAEQAFTPYVGAGAGVAFVNTTIGGQILDLPFDINSTSTQFAYQYMIGAGYKIAPNLRVNLEGRYYATTAPSLQGTVSLGNSLPLAGSYPNGSITVLASLQYKLGAP
jgi:opacity protein-like surface antigen